MSAPLKNRFLGVVIGALVSLSAASAFAHDDENRFQMFLRTGVIDGQYNGVFSGHFTVNLAFDLGAEYFTSPNSSVLVRFIEALDSPDSIPYYTYAGSGQRFYLGSRGPSTEQSDKNIMVAARPKMRYYVAWELGLAEVIVKSFGPVIQSVSTMAEFGLNAGGIYQLSDKFGLELQLGGTLGYGLSSTSVNGNTVRALAGITYFY